MSNNVADNKASKYRKMLFYLVKNKVPGVESKISTRISSTDIMTIGAMSGEDLFNYQVLLEKTIDNSNKYMSKEALKQELSDIISERIKRGLTDREREYPLFRQRLAKLDGESK